jgi:hypothetical protein
VAINTENAHVRPTSTRQSADVLAGEAEQLLRNPAFERGFAAVRDGLVNELAILKHDGQPATDAYERELCRAIRTLNGVKRALTLGVQGNKLRLAEFRPKED